MVFESTQQEAEYANRLIETKLEDGNQELVTLLQKVKDTKKANRKLTKQRACEHEFKLKQNSITDDYKCKKCKFEFSSPVKAVD